jgi:glycosyltransferase involved in cell wall biosynthesis
MQIFFWQNIISPHQAGFMRALAERGHEVTVVARQTLSANRQQLGWATPDLGPARVIVGPTLTDMKRLVSDAPADAIHCVSGARNDATGTHIARECLLGRRRMGIISETPDPRGLLGPLRWGKYVLERATVGWSFDFVLAMGEIGVRWFRKCGYPADRLFPCAYVTDLGDAQAESQANGPFRALYVGQLIPRKGVDVLVRAIARSPGVGLDVIGDGPLRERFKSLADRLGCGGRIRWHGTLSSGDIAPRLGHADALVLPSRHDGWGAVVNEALMAGTPVICSSACGASDLVQHDWLGTVVSAGDVGSLHDAIVRWSTSWGRTPAERRRIREWSQCITGESVAAYLEAVFRHVYMAGERPVVPWRA